MVRLVASVIRSAWSTHQVYFVEKNTKCIDCINIKKEIF